MTTTPLTPEQGISVLRHLAAGKTLDAVALILRTDRSTVLDLASKHGYPDPQKLAWAADVLHEKLDADQAPTQHPRAAEVLRDHGRPQTPAGGASTPSSAGSTSRPRPAAPPSPVAGEGYVARVREEGRGHSNKRIRAAAAKADAAIDRLIELVEDDREKEAARRRAAAERAAAEREVAELEAQLAAARAKLRPAKASSAGAPPTPAALIREWARENDVDCPATGMVPRRVREAYDAARLEAAS